MMYFHISAGINDYFPTLVNLLQFLWEPSLLSYFREDQLQNGYIFKTIKKAVFCLFKHR